MKLFVRTITALGSLALCTAAVGSAAATHEPGHHEAARRIPRISFAPAENKATPPIAQLIGEALGEVCDLTEAQKGQLAELGVTVEKDLTTSQQAKNDLVTALANQVEAGRIDRCALQPQIEALVSAREAGRATLRNGLTQLHSILQPKQRAQFVDALQRGIAERIKMHQQGAFLDQLAKDLGLNNTQQLQIRAEAQKFAPAVSEDREKGKKVLEAFQGDTFAVDQVLPPAEVPEKAARDAKAMVDMADAMTGILTPDQRTHLATKIRERVAGKPAAKPVKPAAEPPAKPTADPAVEPTPEPADEAAPEEATPEGTEGAALEEDVGDSADAMMWGRGGGAAYRSRGFVGGGGYATRSVAASRSYGYSNFGGGYRVGW